jgi:hypothetical protein
MEQFEKKSPSLRRLLLGWMGGLTAAALCLMIGLLWNPDRYVVVPSDRPDPTEAEIENKGNKLVEAALNRGQINYHESLAKIAQPRSAGALWILDFIRILLLSVLPVCIVGFLIRSTVRRVARRGGS